MSVRLLDRDPLTGITRWFHGHADGSFTVHTRQDITAMVAENRAMYNDRPRSRPWKPIEPVARVPLSVVFDPRNRDVFFEGGKRLNRWLNDKDNRVFRLREGRL